MRFSRFDTSDEINDQYQTQYNNLSHASHKTKEEAISFLFSSTYTTRVTIEHDTRRVQTKRSACHVFLMLTPNVFIKQSSFRFTILK